MGNRPSLSSEGMFAAMQTVRPPVKGMLFDGMTSPVQKISRTPY
jgi:hypothetical protein